MSWASRSAVARRALYSASSSGRLFLETAGVVEFGLDAVAAMVECFQHRAVDAEIGEHAHQDDEGNGDPEFRFGEHRTYPFKDASTA